MEEEIYKSERTGSDIAKQRMGGIYAVQRSGSGKRYRPSGAFRIADASGKRTEYAQEVFSTDRHEIKIGGATYCVQRSFRDQRSAAEIIAKKILESSKTDGKIDVFAPVSYNMNGKLVQGG